MNKKGAIILVEDDEDDQSIIQEILKDLQIKNEIVMLCDGVQAYEYLEANKVEPFLIISDINMPRMNGTELRDKMQKEGELRLRTVPFLFLTTGAAPDNIITAYAHSVQGFFTKSSSYAGLKKTFHTIIEYWGECVEPIFSPKKLN